MTQTPSPSRVSIHGGHSGEFCNHARDALEDIVRAYIDRGFEWVGITEHMPPISDRFLYPDEKQAGLDARALYQRFARYICTCRMLQHKYRRAIDIYIGFETESYSGSMPWIQELRQKFKPDYIVGSVHHVNDIPIDTSKAIYDQAADGLGGYDNLYCRYFDRQHELIKVLAPAVVGHFDLVRIFDPEYKTRLEKPEIRQRIHRNLKRIQHLGLILDFNVRALAKNADEPYISKSILLRARQLGIAVVPGDDSHGLESVGSHIQSAIAILESLGFNTLWRRPPRRKTAWAES